MRQRGRDYSNDARAEDDAQDSTVRQRSAYWDNARALLIILVVLGHVLGLSLKATEFGRIVFLTIYLFHMPAFAFVAGVFAKPDPATPAGRNRWWRLAGLFVAFQALHVGSAWLITGAPVPPNPYLYPAYTLWWIQSLLMWTLLLPVFSGATTTRAASMAVGVAVLGAAASGMILPNGSLFSLSRTAVFFPFYLVGFYYTRLQWQLRRSWRLALGALAVFAVVAWAVSTRNPDTIENWAQARLAFGEFAGGVVSLQDAVVRVFLIGVSAVLTAAFLQFVPARTTFFTRLGRSTLSVYLWHGVVLSSIALLGWTWVADAWWKVPIVVVVLVVTFGFGPVADFTVGLLGRSDRGPVSQRTSDADDRGAVA